MRRRGRWWGSVVGPFVLVGCLWMLGGAGAHAKQPHALVRVPAQGSLPAPASTTAMGAWNGTSLVTAQITNAGNLYAYAQTPGVSKWTRETVAKVSANGGNAYFKPWIVATATSLQIVAIDAAGHIWFWQQADGSTGWSKPMLVDTLQTSNILISAPKIAWTGVPGHSGTNSVITAVDGNSGTLLFWHQTANGWSAAQTVADNASYYNPAVTATNTGIVIVAPEAAGTFQSFYQPYGGTRWTSDGSMGIGSGQRYMSVSVTWDGVNVDVAAAFADGQEGPELFGDRLVFLWKSNSAQFWSDVDIAGPSSTQPLAAYPAIYETGDNLIIAAAQQMSSSTERMDFWWQGSTFTSFNFEKVDTLTTPDEYGSPTLVSTTGSGGEVAIFAPIVDAKTADGIALDDWTEPFGGSVWSPPTTIAQ